LLQLSILGRVVCPSSERARTIALVLGWFVELVSLGVLGGSVYTIVEYDAFAAFVARHTLLVFAATAGGFAAFFALTLYGVYLYKPLICLAAYWVLLLLDFATTLGTLFLAYWVWTSDDIPVSSVNAISGSELQTHVEKIDNFLSRELAVPLSVIEGSLCATYQLCCRDPALDVLASIATVVPSSPVNGTTCIAPPEGVLTDLAVTLQDPSAPNFCPYVTGAPAHLIVAPPAGVCHVLETVNADFARGQCQAAYCEEGVDAYLEFINLMIAMLQRYAVPLAALLGSLVVLILILACNVRYVRRLKRQMVTTTVGSVTRRKTDDMGV